MIVRVPASTANLGPGFDTLGMALSLHLEVGVEPLEDSFGPAESERHPAVVAFRRLGGTGSLFVRSPIPMGRGLGFSGAARVAGLVAAVAQRDGGFDLDEHCAEIMALAGSIVTLAATASFNTATIALTLAGTVDTSIANVSASLSRLGTASKSLETHLNFITKLQDSLDAGVGNLVDADLAKESARLQALQTKQQLGIQALSIANSSASSLLGLFR